MPKGAKNTRMTTHKSRPVKESRIKRGYTYKWEKYRSRFLAANPLCVRCLAKGRTTAAQHVDHITPVTAADDPLFWPASNHQALCAECHGRKTVIEDVGRGRSKRKKREHAWSATLVCGPPCSGKNTYVEKQNKTGDMLIDVDALHNAISGEPTHEHSAELLPFAFEARDAIVEKLQTSSFAGHVWVIATAPTRGDRMSWSGRLGCDVHLLKTPKDICLARAETERPAKWIGYVKQWFYAYEKDACATGRDPE